MPTFLSIDWDFFPAFTEDGRTPLPNGGSVPNALLYDWGLGETGAVGALEGYLWHSRGGHFRALGLDLTEEFGIREDRGSTRPEDFVAELQRLGGGELAAPTAWADSHQWAYAALRNVVEETGEPMTVLHFDAHHDLGYKQSQIERMRRQGKVDCGCWLLAALEQGLAKEVHVVYPEWRGLNEWKGSQELEWFPPPATQAWTWRSYLERFGEETQEVAGIFVARSGGWTPPYLDEELSDMIEALAHRAPLCMRIGPEVDMPRDWNEAEVERECEMRLEMAATRGAVPGAAKVGRSPRS